MTNFSYPIERVGFAVVASTAYGPMILHRLDPNQGQYPLMHGASFNHNDILLLANVINKLGPDSVFLDIGANVGFFTIALARLLGPLGRCHSFEAQPVIFNMLAGSVALNGLVNTQCHNACVGRTAGKVEVPAFDYFKNMQFGSVEFGPVQRERLQQERQTPTVSAHVPMVRIDDMEFPRVDLMKVDVEGMEVDVLEGARNTIAACKPVIYAEHLKCGQEPLRQALESFGYKCYNAGSLDFLAIHSERNISLLAA